MKIYEIIPEIIIMLARPIGGPLELSLYLTI